MGLGHKLLINKLVPDVEGLGSELFRLRNHICWKATPQDPETKTGIQAVYFLQFLMHERSKNDLVLLSSRGYGPHNRRGCPLPFQLNLQDDLAIHERECLFERWHTLTATGIKLTDFRKCKVHDFASSVGRPINSWVMHKNELLIFGQLDIDLNLISAEINCPSQGTQGVLRLQCSRTAM
jgi:hypothetical protein